MKLYLPNSAWLGNIDQFLKKIDTSDETSLDITSHKKWISVHPVVLTMVAALGIKARNNKKPINFEIMEATSKHYFERMGLFQILQLKSGIKIKKHEAAGRFIPLQIIKSSQELDKFITDMIPLLHKEPEKVAPIKYVITELVRNVLEHAGSEAGAVVCAQYYPDTETIRIGVSDVGMGIKKSISYAHTPKTELDAIHLALTPGITGKTKKVGGTGDNAGAGLFFTKSLAKVNRDFFMLYSGSTMYKLLKSPNAKKIKLIADPSKDHYSHGEDYPYWPGTVVAIDLCLKENEEFEKVLEMIHEFYRETRKEKMKTQYRRARFI